MFAKSHRILNTKFVGLFLVTCLLLFTWVSLLALETKQPAANQTNSPVGIVGPAFSKTFTPNTIGPGSTTTLRFDINNSSFPTPVTDLAFTDNLPAGVTIADPANVVNTCGQDALIAAPDGGSTITLSNGDLPGFSSCFISVNVTSSTPGEYNNTSGDLTSSAGNSGPAAATLSVATDRPGFSKSFSPSNVTLGSRSTLTFLIDNVLNSSQVTNLAFVDNFPAGMAIANPANVNSTCMAGAFTGGVITADPGTNFISLSNGGGANTGAVDPNSTCTITVDVITTGSGELNNVTSDLTGVVGFASLNSGKASATLTVPSPIDKVHLIKDFVNDPVPPNGTVDLVFHIQNYNRSDGATNITFTDDLDATLSGLAATGLPQSNVCGSGSNLTGSGLISLTGGNLSAGESCTFTVTLQVPTDAPIGAYPNTTSTVSSFVNGSPVAGNTASDTLFVEPIPIFTKEFIDDPVTGGDSVILRFTIQNTDPTTSSINIAFTDDIGGVPPPDGRAGALPGLAANGLIAANGLEPDPLVDPCGAGSLLTIPDPNDTNPAPPFPNFEPDPTLLVFTGGSLAPAGQSGDSCTFVVVLDVPFGTPTGSYLNTTSELTASPLGASGASDALNVVAAPTLRKSFTDDPVAPGGTVTLEFTLAHPTEAVDPASSITFTDDLSLVLPGLTVNLPANPDPPCGAGSTLTGSNGDTFLTLLDGTLLPGESCTFSVTLDVPAATAPGKYTNTTSGVSATVDGSPTSSTGATDVLNIAGLDFTKEFLNDPVIAGEIVTLRFTIENVHPTDDATNIQFSDDLTAVLPGVPDLTAILPETINSCGGTLSGTTSLSYSGGSLTSGSQCTIEVDILVPLGATSNSYRNSTSSLTATQGGSITIDPAVDFLVINNTILEVSKAFIDDPVAPGNTVSLEFTIVNSHPTYNVTDIALEDVLDANLTGLVAVGLPTNDVCGAGSQLSGTSTINLTGGNLAGGGSCTFTTTLQVPANAAASLYNNTTNTPTGTAHDQAMNAFPILGNPASDKLLVTELGFIVVDKVTIPDGDSTPFTFNLTDNATINRTFPLAATDSPENSPVPPGTGYVITETVPSGWQLVSATCDNGSPINNITVTASEVVTCTFTNTNAADLAISISDAPDPVLAGNNLTHIITISNSGPLPATNVSVSITLPISLTYVSGTGSGWSCGESGGTVTCDLASLDVAATSEITLVTAVPADTPAGYVTTYASVTADQPDTDSGNNNSSEDTFIGEPKITYLPVIFNNFVSAPDLVVQSISTPSANTVEVVIANVGNAPVLNSFWVDLYINPNPAPTGVNQIWQSIASEGMVWGVTDVSALVPGGTITLTLNSSSYEPAYSNFNGFTNGMNVYVQVDSAHATSIVYGAVLEDHEIAGDPYNNISNITVALP